MANPLTLAWQLIETALHKGADHAEATVFHTKGRHIEWRQGRLVESEDENDLSIGLRAFVGASAASLSGNDISEDALNQMAQRAVSMAGQTPADDHSLPASPDQISAVNDTDMARLDLFEDSPLLSQKDLIERAQSIEEAGFKHKGITKSDGAATSHTHSTIICCGDNGMESRLKRSVLSSQISLIAGEGEGMERDYAYDSTVYQGDHLAPDAIGNLAAQRTLARLNPRSGKTGSFPVIYDRRVATSLLRHALRAINGSAIVRKTSFLTDRLHEAVFNSSITILDDPHRQRGLKSRLLDAEGFKTAPLTLVQEGVLNHFLTDLRSARLLGIESNARAARGLSSPPSPASTNVHIAASNTSLDDMIGDIQDGFYITELMGSQISMTTGDYSRGASGFWIENGQLAYPVDQMTVAGNLNDMFLALEAADDLEGRMAVDSPSLLIRKMSCASA